MEPFVRNFIRSSLVWLGVGVLPGVSMVFAPMQTLIYRPAHMHANLLGFVSMIRCRSGARAGGERAGG